MSGQIVGVIDSRYVCVSRSEDERVSPMVWLLIGYMWLFIHRPFEVWTWLARIHIERVYMIAVILCWLLMAPATPPPNRLHWRYLAFIIVMLASWLLSPYQDVGTRIWRTTSSTPFSTQYWSVRCGTSRTCVPWSSDTWP